MTLLEVVGSRSRTCEALCSVASRVDLEIFVSNDYRIVYDEVSLG